MAFQNVKTPRFYINCIEWFDKIGLLADSRSRYDMSLFYTLSASSPRWITPGNADGYNDTYMCPKFTIPYKS